MEVDTADKTGRHFPTLYNRVTPRKANETPASWKRKEKKAFAPFFLQQLGHRLGRRVISVAGSIGGPVGGSLGSSVGGTVRRLGRYGVSIAGSVGSSVGGLVGAGSRSPTRLPARLAARSAARSAFRFAARSASRSPIGNPKHGLALGNACIGCWLELDVSYKLRGKIYLIPNLFPW